MYIKYNLGETVLLTEEKAKLVGVEIYTPIKLMQVRRSNRYYYQGLILSGALAGLSLTVTKKDIRKENSIPYLEDD